MKVDEKGRLTVPSKFATVLAATVGGQLVVAKSPDGCLSLYPLPVWEQFEAEMRGWPLEMDGWRRLYVGSASDVEIDGASRVLIPPELRRWAGLEREVKFMGVGAYFELWDSTRYDEREARMLAGERPETLQKAVIR
ncbi:MAG: division/cell wall cluster transcriptional repressor MraZ [Proteobacteria bacterium]|nr:division/cell wall cluster transcriptional repressor MraZ [Pseudomonadota bacterium]